MYWPEKRTDGRPTEHFDHYHRPAGTHDAKGSLPKRIHDGSLGHTVSKAGYRAAFGGKTHLPGDLHPTTMGFEYICANAKVEMAELDEVLSKIEAWGEEEFFAEHCPPLPSNHAPQESEPEMICKLYSGRRWSPNRRAREEWGEREWRVLSLPTNGNATGMDPIELRKKIARDLRLWGGVDKREIAKGKGAIDKHLGELVPLAKEGGFIPTVDHVVTPDISLENFRHYMKRKMDLHSGRFW